MTNVTTDVIAPNTVHVHHQRKPCCIVNVVTDQLNNNGLLLTAYCLLLTVLYYEVQLFPAQTKNYPEGISDHDHIIPALHERCKIVLHKLPKQ